MELGFGAKTIQKKGETKFRTDIFFGEFATVPQTHKLDKALPNYFA